MAFLFRNKRASERARSDNLELFKRESPCVIFGSTYNCIYLARIPFASSKDCAKIYVTRVGG